MTTTIIDSNTQRFRRRPLHEDVAEYLRDMITNETLPEGSHIDESALCVNFDISRTPLREALKVLQAEGLVSIEPNRGSHVSITKADELEQLFEVLSGIERLAAELCCQQADANSLKIFSRLQAQMENAFANNDRSKYFSACQSAHQMVIQLAGNKILATTHRLLVSRTRRTRFRAIASKSRWKQSVEEHRALTAALINRDTQQAGRTLANHVRGSGQAIVDHLRKPNSAPK
ncbi:MAG: GntR family transcriptional regulator [Motiliproteus sp.]